MQIVKRNRSWLIISIAIVLVVFPFLLNWLIQIPRPVDIVGDGSTWLNFWPVYLSSIASFVMILLTYRMLKQSQYQILEMQRQRSEDERARLVFSFIISECAYYLKISNIGKNNAFDIIVNVNSDFVSDIEEKYQSFFTDLDNPFFVEANKSIYIFMGFCEDVNETFKNSNVDFIATGTYNDKYKVNERISLSQIINKHHFVVRNKTENSLYYMKKGLIVQNDSYMPIQKSLDVIAKNIEKIRGRMENHENDINAKD